MRFKVQDSRFEVQAMRRQRWLVRFAAAVCVGVGLLATSAAQLTGANKPGPGSDVPRST